jgi:hypothetical protein
VKTVARLMILFAVAAFLVAGSGCRGRIPPGLISKGAKEFGKGPKDFGKVPKDVGKVPKDVGKVPKDVGKDPGRQFGGMGGSGNFPKPPPPNIVVPFVVPPTRPLGDTAKRVAEHADDVPVWHLDARNRSLKITEALAHTHDPQARGLLVTSRACFDEVQTVARVKPQLVAGHEIEAQIEHLPESVQNPIRAWSGVCRSSESLTVSWDQSPPDVSRLTDSLKDVNRVNPQLAGTLRTALVKKATAAGKPDVARRLRDVMLDPAEAEVVPPVAGKRLDLLPLPEAPRGGQPSQRGSPLKGLADLGDEAKEQAQTVYTQAVRQTERFGDFQYTLGRHHMHHLTRLASRAIEKKDDRDEKKSEERGTLFAAVEDGLKRKLRPSERLIVADMRGQQVDVIVKTIAALK